MEEVLGECLRAEIKIVANAGGLNPRGLGEALAELAAQARRSRARIAVVEGDDLDAAPRRAARRRRALRAPRQGHAARRASAPLTANAYLGGWGIAEALARGADIVVTGRVTDAALVVGPAAWHFGWRRDDWDRLAGAVAAGHIIECSAQATGGNYTLLRGGRLVASRSASRSPRCTTTARSSSPSTPAPAGCVNVGTVTAQLLYEIDGAALLQPRRGGALRHASRLTDEGHDRVRGSGTRGEPPPPTLKVAHQPSPAAGATA